jgi:hypothetical protein
VVSVEPDLEQGGSHGWIAQRIPGALPGQVEIILVWPPQSDKVKGKSLTDDRLDFVMMALPTMMIGGSANPVGLAP